MMSIRVGLIGYGLAGSVFHAPLIGAVEGLELKAVVTSSNAAKAAYDFPRAKIMADVQSLFGSSEVDCIVVSSPNATHYDYAKQAILAGKHVVVEKPFTVTSEEAEELVMLAERQGVILTVYQNRRWDNDFLTVRSLLDTGMLGKLSVYESHYDRYRPQVQKRWKEEQLPGSGILYDLGSHLIDQTLVLFGMPETVSADLRLERKGTEIVDYYHLVLGYSNGMRAILHSGSLVRQPGPRFLLHGDKGSYMKFGLDPQEEQLKKGLRPGDIGWAEEPAALHGQLTADAGDLSVRSVIETKRGSYETFYVKLADAIGRGGEVPVPARDARNTIRIIEAAVQSDREQRRITFAENDR
ncbi:oxidoreductase [Paenibacillus tarimensis]